MDSAHNPPNDPSIQEKIMRAPLAPYGYNIISTAGIMPEPDLSIYDNSACAFLEPSHIVTPQGERNTDDEERATGAATGTGG